MSDSASNDLNDQDTSGNDGVGQAQPAPADAKPPSRIQQMLVEYGVVGIIVLLSLSALTYVGFAVAFLVGFEVDGAGETAGVLAAAAAGWLLTKPVRIPLAIVLTPFVAAGWRRLRGQPAIPPTAPED